MHESDELYLLSAESDASVKVRDASIDVKRLERVDEDGLELWRPTLKAAFPLSATDVGSVLEALGAAAPPLARGAYTLDQLVDELAGPSPDLLAVKVHKRRAHYALEGCMAESTEVRTDGVTTRTIAVESADAALVLATVRELGLASRPNTSFPRGLKALAGFAQRYAVIDVGTNSVKLHVGERRADGGWQAIVDRVEITRLGEGLEQSGRLNPGADRADGRRDRGHGRPRRGGAERSRSRRSAPPGSGSPRTAPSSSPP